MLLTQHTNMDLNWQLLKRTERVELNRGCIPFKLLIRIVDLAETTKCEQVVGLYLFSIDKILLTRVRNYDSHLEDSLLKLYNKITAI